MGEDVTTWVVLLTVGLYLALALVLVVLGVVALLRAPRHRVPEVVRELAGLARALRRRPEN